MEEKRIKMFWWLIHSPCFSPLNVVALPFGKQHQAPPFLLSSLLQREYSKGIYEGYYSDITTCTLENKLIHMLNWYEMLSHARLTLLDPRQSYAHVHDWKAFTHTSKSILTQLKYRHVLLGIMFIWNRFRFWQCREPLEAKSVLGSCAHMSDCVAVVHNVHMVNWILCTSSALANTGSITLK